MSETKEEQLHITGPAILTSTGRVITKPIPAAHWELEQEMEEGELVREKLFMHSGGKTCTREAAAQVAFEAGQTGRLRSKIFSNEIRAYKP